MRTGQLPGAVDGGGMGNVEVRRGVTDRWGEPEPAGDGIRKSVAGNGSRRVIGRLAPGVRTSELDAVAEPLLHIDQKARILGAGAISYFPDTPEISVDPQIRAGWIRWPQVTRGGLRRDHHIAIVAPEHHVNAVGSDITHRGRHRGGNLVLYVDIPLLDVISPGIGFLKRTQK